ncbi:MAG: GDP-mannose 4,6-dehydratase [Candidatus Aenigmatarchaeota archaeon]|nr:MAG: GDP-mannose 4,6-dehydratase [Candidatus Aenigmarchaeota archaeon]
MSDILVTGCAGFIGSHLCENLLKQGLKVAGLDNLDPYYSTEWKENNLKVLKKQSNFNFIKGSILDSNLLKDIIKDVEIVYHLAALPGVRNSIKTPVKYCETDVLGTIKLLDVSRNMDVKKFAFASSSSVYGEVPENELPVSEDRKPNPISPYGLAKTQGEEWCKMFEEVYGLKTVSLRYFTVFGPRQRPDEAFSKFIMRIMKDEEIEIYGDGNQTRDFTYISDIVNGTLLACEKGNGIYNIGSNKRISVNEMVDLIEKIMNKKAQIKYIEKQLGDVTHTWSKIDKAKRDLGYGPKVSIEEGIKRHVEWFKMNKFK